MMAPAASASGIVERAPIVDSIISQLSLSSMAFIVPPTANVKDHIWAQLVINPAATEEELRRELTRSGQITSGQVLVSKIVEAKLSAPDFDVTKITPEQQAISATETTSWEWELEPTKPGTHNVYLTITAIVQVDNTLAQRHIKTFDKLITIKITPAQVVHNWISNNWQWVWSTLFVPLALIAWKYRMKLFTRRR